MRKLDSPVQIIGGGIAGLNCAAELAKLKIPYQVSEASDGWGGRMRTDEVDGFRLDRGFQVFQTAYPEARASLNYPALDLAPLVAGALVRYQSRWVSMVDPVRHPSYAFRTLFNSIGGLADRWKIMRLMRDVRATPLDDILAAGPDQSTKDMLENTYQFSPEFVSAFLRPWLSGIFLEGDLSTSANFCRFVLKMLASDRVMYPRQGIQAIPDQLLSKLATDSMHLHRKLKAMDDKSLNFADGVVTLDAPAVLALSQAATSQLLPDQVSSRPSVTTTCAYFAADGAPVADPILMLNGQDDGLINHVFVMTNASTQLAPAGRSLISVTLVGEQPYDAASVRSQLINWYGQQAQSWTELAVYTIPHALPSQPARFRSADPPAVPSSVILCGDHTTHASLQGALQSGRLAAQQVSERLAT